MAQAVKRLTAVRETQVRSLHQEDPLEKEMATHSRILAWKIPWTEEPGWLQSIGFFFCYLNYPSAAYSPLSQVLDVSMTHCSEQDGLH